MAVPIPQGRFIQKYGPEELLEGNVFWGKGRIYVGGASTIASSITTEVLSPIQEWCEKWIAAHA